MHDAMTLFGALARGELPARVPITANLLDQGAEELGMSTGEYYSNADNVTEGQLRLLSKYGHDVVWGAHYIARQAEMLGATQTDFPARGVPNVGDMVIKKWKDIEKLEVPKNIASHPAFEIQAKTIAGLHRELGGKIPVCAFQAGSFTLPSILMGMNEWMELLLTGPQSLVRELLTKCSDFTISVFRAFRDAGATFVAYANPMASTDFFALNKLTRLALPWIQRDVAGTGTDGLIYFSGGARIATTVPMLTQHTDIGIYHLNPFDDISAAKTATAGKALIVAAINDIPLIDCTEAEIRESVRRIMQRGAPGGGFIFGTLMMPCDIPESSIRAMIRAGHEFGTYIPEA
jgi:uroporphyrinogen decarboxylase